jgi:hypothetical protein
MFPDTRFNPSSGGHAPGHLRGFFWSLLDLDEFESEREWPKRLRPDMDPLGWVCRQLHNCTDVMPSGGCADLVMPPGSTYVQGARWVLRQLSDPRSSVSEAQGKRMALCNQIRFSE